MTDNKPKILITGSHKPNSIDPYTNSVNRVGGLAVSGYLPYITEDEVGEYDGLLVAGGCDVTPTLYGEEFNGAVNTDINRDNCEIELMRIFRKAGKPIFGICRGLQIMNVAFGGTLIQDLPKTPDHRTYDNSNPTIHKAIAEKGSILADLYGEHYTINSYHHEALKTVAYGFKVTSYSDDSLKVVEAVEHINEPIFGVQFHPERMGAPADDGDVIMKYFVDMCRKE